MQQETTIRTHLADVLASRRFVTAPRLGQFLGYVVDKTLVGETHEIKEYVVALEVYGRSADYNPQIDSTVRVEASRLRARLRAYYENEGAGSPVRIELPKGSYVPLFHIAGEVTPVVTPEPPPERPKSMHAVFALVLAGFVGTVLWATQPRTAHAHTRVDRNSLELFLRADGLLRHPVMDNGWPGAVPASVSDSITLLQQVVQRAPAFTPAWLALPRRRSGRTNSIRCIRARASRRQRQPWRGPWRWIRNCPTRTAASLRCCSIAIRT